MTSTDSLALSAAATSNGRDLLTTGTFGVINPATGEVFAQAPSVTPDQLDDVFDAAQNAYLSWRIDDEYRRLDHLQDLPRRDATRRNGRCATRSRYRPPTRGRRGRFLPDRGVTARSSEGSCRDARSTP
ncbi:aldehyde dehydrogenase family protein [Streptomyces sp. NPDC050698]